MMLRFWCVPQIGGTTRPSFVMENEKMSDELIELEEEEHTAQLTGPVLQRIVGLLKPHWKWVVGFIVTIMLTSILDAYFTYLNKQIVDVGITLKDRSALMRSE